VLCELGRILGAEIQISAARPMSASNFKPFPSGPAILFLLAGRLAFDSARQRAIL